MLNRKSDGPLDPTLSQVRAADQLTHCQLFAPAHGITQPRVHIPFIQSYCRLTDQSVTCIARTSCALRTEGTDRATMATTITCDRCGTKIIPREDGYEQTKILFMPAAEDDLPEYDLCVTCTQEFRVWITPRSNPDPVTRARARVQASRADLPRTERPRSP